MSNICDFHRILKTECNLQHFTRNCRIKNLDDFERDETRVFVKEKEMTICYIMNYCLVMLLRGGKVNVVMKHCRRVKGQQLSTLQMAQQLKTKKY